jgi:hypothetical protein
MYGLVKQDNKSVQRKSINTDNVFHFQIYTKYHGRFISINATDREIPCRQNLRPRFQDTNGLFMAAAYNSPIFCCPLT